MGWIITNSAILVALAVYFGFDLLRPWYRARRGETPPASSAKPDYVPGNWRRTPLNERIWKSPRRMFWWLVLWPACGLVGGIVLLVSNHSWGGVAASYWHRL